MIISNPSVDPTRVVVVRFLSWHEWLEQSCVLEPGDHPFVRHRTCVDYFGAEFVTLDQLTSFDRTGDLKRKAPVSAEVLARIHAAAETSDIRLKYYEVLREQGFVP